MNWEKEKKLRKTSALVITAVFFAVSAVQAAYLDQDFESLTVGNYYDGGSGHTAADAGAVSWSGSVRAYILDGDQPAEEVGNQSLRLWDSLTGQFANLTYQGDDVAGTGVFSMDFNMVDYEEKDLDIELGQNGNINGDALIIRIDNGAMSLLTGAGWKSLDNTVTMGLDSTLVINFNTHADTFTGTLNGSALAAGGTTSWTFRESVGEVSSIDTVSFDTYVPASQTDVYIDNLRLFWTPPPGSPLPFHETFEANAPMAGTPGALDGQHGWSDPSSNALVQASESWEFDQAVSIGSAEILQSVGDVTATNVQLVFAWNPVAGNLDAADIPADATVVFWANADGGLSAYSNQVPVEISGVSAQAGQWSRILVQSDYAAQEWSLWLDGTQVIDRFGFYADSLSYMTEIAFRSDSLVLAYFDDILLDTDLWVPQPGDTDGDGLEDDWEVLYFRSPHALSSGAGDYDSDGQSDGEEEIAYTDPTDDTSVFGILDGTLVGSTGYVIHWPSASGRVYAVDSATNLLAGGWSNVENGIPATPPENTYTVLVDSVEAKFIRVQAGKE